MKNLLLIVPTLRLGGQERVCAKTAELLKEDYDVSIIVFDSTGAVYHPDCEIIDLNIPAQDGKWNKVRNAIRRARAVKLIRRERKADFVYSFGDTANLVNALSYGTGKTLVSIHHYLYKNWLNSFWLGRSDAIVACAKTIGVEVGNWGEGLKQKCVAIQNPIDISPFMEKGLEKIEDYTFSPHTIVSHGRLHEVKNWSRLIKAFSIVKKSVSDAQLLIIGEGEQRKQLEDLISAYDLNDSVTLPGFRQNPFAYLAKSSLYVLPSYSEGFPNSLVEGMVFLPTISVDCKSGPREILSNAPIDTVAQGIEYADYGILVRPTADRVFHQEITEDDKLLAEAMLAVLQDPDLAQRMREAATERAAEFSCGRYREKLIGILEP